MALCPRFFHSDGEVLPELPSRWLGASLKEAKRLPFAEWGAALRLVADCAPFGKALFVLFQRLAQGGFPLQA